MSRQTWQPTETVASSGRIRVHLGKGHPFANSAGWQWRSRYVVMRLLGRKLRADEQVHHLNGEVWDDRPENLEVVVAEDHGRTHAFVTDLAGWRAPDGRFVEHEGHWTRWASRSGALTGPLTRELPEPRRSSWSSRRHDVKTGDRNLSIKNPMGWLGTAMVVSGLFVSVPLLLLALFHLKAYQPSEALAVWCYVSSAVGLALVATAGGAYIGHTLVTQKRYRWFLVPSWVLMLAGGQLAKCDGIRPL